MLLSFLVLLLLAVFKILFGERIEKEEGCHAQIHPCCRHIEESVRV
jgi:hypothetical protein